MRSYEIVAGSSSLEGLRRCERPDPEPLPNQILVRMQAASLNYRDLLVARGHYMGGPVAANTIQLSDGVGEVIGVGGAVTRFRIGDRVSGTFFSAAGTTALHRKRIWSRWAHRPPMACLPSSSFSTNRMRWRSRRSCPRPPRRRCRAQP